MFTHRAFYHPLYKTVEAYLQYADTKYNPVYLYRFAYRGPASYSLVYTGTTDNFGVGHLDDLIYMFRTSAIFPEFPKNSPYADLIKDLIETYVNFAKIGYVHFSYSKQLDDGEFNRILFSIYLIDRRPTIWDETRPCDRDHQGDFCDYQEFRNSGKDGLRHEIRTDDQFNLKMVEFWDDLLDS